MNYFSTKQLSEKWRLSSKRITQLCQQGRIDGAILRDRRWLIPENATKPADTRTKEAKTAKNEDKFVFPHIIAAVHSPEQVNSFSEYEKALYRAECLYEAGEFEECAAELKKLLATDNKYIRLGALYLLPLAYLYQSDMESMTEYAVVFKTAYYELSEHTVELSFLLDFFNAEISNFQNITYSIDHCAFSDFHDDNIPYFSVANAAAEIINSGIGAYPANVLSHEVICAKIEREGYFYCAMMLHSYISLMYAARHDEESENRHLRRAIDIAVEHNIYFSFAQTMTYTPDKAFEILRDYPDDIVQNFRHCASVFVKARTALAEYFGSSPMLSQLRKDDYVLISYCLKEYSGEKTAELLSITESGVKKRLSSLYKKLGVSNKKDMMNKYVTLVLNPAGGKDTIPLELPPIKKTSHP